MLMKLHMQGELPPRWLDALEALAPDLGFTHAPDGIPLIARRGKKLMAAWDGSVIEIEWSKPVEFYRALSLLPRPLTVFSVEETACFQTTGMMFDSSRNAVLKPHTLQFFIRKMALMGLDLGMMYTEDTYEVPSQPYFGYQRGRYTMDELRALDDYADMLGIELCPCIQTLGHLNRVLHWPAMMHLQDNDEVLLADLEETYSFLEEIITAAAAPYRSKRIHIGMDEAHGVGLGRHLREFGYEKPYTVLRRHLEKVLSIVKKQGLTPMMWSDMFFRLESPTNGYYDGPIPSQEAIQAVHSDVDLVYWDYYHETEEEYLHQLDKHAVLPAPTVFAGGIWTWCGLALDYAKTKTVTVAALSACKKRNIPLVFATAWGDNGAEANLLTALLGMQMYAEFTYRGTCEDNWVNNRLHVCCGEDARAFWGLTDFNCVAGMSMGTNRPVNAAKFLLYQDPLVQLFADDISGLDMSGHYAGLAIRYRSFADQGNALASVWDFYALLANVLALKCVWHEQASSAVCNKDQQLAERLADNLSQTIIAVETLRTTWLDLWNGTNKPQGFEVIDGRLGAVKARLATAQSRMYAYARGQCETIPELTEPPLPYLRCEDGTLNGCYVYGDIVSACKVNG